MSFWASLDNWLALASFICQQPMVVAMQIQGCLICLFFAAGFAFASSTRARELQELRDKERDGNPLSFLCPELDGLEHSVQAKLPRVAVVMPVKGLGEHSLSNWYSQVVSLYGGPLEFLFVVESLEDPAYDAVSQLLLDLKGQFQCRVLLAGLASRCSQKIHNQLAGVDAMHLDTKYVLFLDDDVRFHPGSIGCLVSNMENHPEIFIQTGYPLDVPSGSLGSYCIYEYHMVIMQSVAAVLRRAAPGGFATGGRTIFLWGGCMMMHAADFRSDRYGMVTGLRDGGYSDDMTLAAVSGANKRVIWSPPRAIFIHPLARDLSFSRYWNYLRKQTIVLETYNTPFNWMMNRALFYSHCWLSWGFCFQYVTTAVHLLAAVRLLFGGSFNKYPSCSTGLSLSALVALCTGIEVYMIRYLTKVEIDLCSALSPETQQVAFKDYNWLKVFAAMFVDNFLYPVSAIYSHVFQTIEWSGVRYKLRFGKIYKMEKLDGAPPTAKLYNGPAIRPASFWASFYRRDLYRRSAKAS